MSEIDVYQVVGKVAPNEWRLINEIYEEFTNDCFEFYYLKQAEVVRRDLKNYLSTHHPKNKVPVSILKTRKSS
jgi:uncharacterized pyridoxamine 5'-phosphate oxidase family protein